MYLVRRLIVGISSCLVLNAVPLSQMARSTPALTASSATPVSKQIAQSQAGVNATYEKARQFMRQQFGEPKGNDYYALYRVVELLARANDLNDRPWRIRVIPTYDINAFATEVNLLAFYNGLLDQIDGDRDALACVVGHEMAHHTQKHIPVSVGEKQRILKQLQQEAVDEVAAENEDLRKDLTALDLGTTATGVVNQAVGGGVIGQVVTGVFQSGRRRRVEEAQNRVKEIYAQKQAKLEKEWQELSHRHEFEADKFGYQYMVRAGFKPEGCLTLFSVMERLDTSQIASNTHPLASDRIAAVRALSSQYPTSKLVSEGKVKLKANPKPLTYDKSRDGQSLRVDSKAAGNRF